MTNTIPPKHAINKDASIVSNNTFVTLPCSVPVVDPNTGVLSPAWRNAFENQLAPTIASLSATSNNQNTITLSGAITGSGISTINTSLSSSQSGNISWTGIQNYLSPITGISFNNISGLANSVPLIDGIATIGISTLVSPQDHIHPTDTTRQVAYINLTSIGLLANAAGSLTNDGSGNFSYVVPSGSGTVTSVSTAAANNGITATWATATTTPALTIGLGNITPTSLSTATITDTSMTQGSILYAGTGGLVSQDNGNLYYNPIGYAGMPHLIYGPGSSSPMDAAFEFYVTSGVNAHFHNLNTTQSTTGGVTVQLLYTPTGAAVTSGNRVGSIEFGGTYDTSYDPASISAIRSYTTQTLSSGSLGGKLVFQTVPNGSTTLTTALTLNQDQTSVFASSVTGTSFNSITGLGAANPLMDGSVSVGSSTLVSRQDHVHPSDTTKASTSQTFYLGTTPIAINAGSGTITTIAGLSSVSSTGFTGTLQTAAQPNITSVGTLTSLTSTGAITGTSFNSITGLASVAPLIDGTATVGVSTLTARQDHIHPTDTTRASSSATLTLGSTLLTLGGTTTSVAGLTLTGAALNGTLGATTPSTIAATTLGASGIFSETNTTDASAIGTASTVFSGGISVAKSHYQGGVLYRAGTGSAATQSNLMYQAWDTQNAYIQNNIQNLSTGASASADYIVTQTAGTDGAGYLDLGVNGSAYSVGTWTINGANDGYLYMDAGNLAIGTDTSGKNLVLFAGGTLTANTAVTFNGTTASFPIPTLITNNTVSTTTGTGALIITGGVGIGGALYGTTANFSGTSTYTGLSTFTTGLICTASASTATAGYIGQDSTQKAIGTYQNGLKQITPGVMFTQTATGTNGANTAITNILGTGIGTAVLPASWFLVGKTIRIRVWGTYTTTSAPGTTIITLYLNAGTPVTVVASSSTTLTVSLTTAPFWMEFDLICRSTTTVIASGILRFSSVNTGLTSTVINVGTATAATIVNATSYTINVSATNGTASGCIYITQGSSIEVLN